MALSPASGPKVRKPLGRPQTPEELAFYARNFFRLSVVAVVFFPPLGLAGLYFSKQTDEANQCSDWEDAYRNSNRTVWVDMFSILTGIGLIYLYVLFI
uniref:PMIS2 transmembrane protein n=1 Tax=Nannospalax galili TaxID=1026970 RepID=A0A8C6W9K2_NANGA